MDKSLILMLVFSFILSGISYYLGYRRPANKFPWLAKVTFLSVTLFLIPVLVIVLYFQDGAKARLSETGFIPYPHITESVGIAFGTGKNPTWIFKTRDLSGIEKFYSDESNRPGWKLINSDPNLIIYQKGNKKMSIGQQKGWTSSSVIYMLETN